MLFSLESYDIVIKLSVIIVKMETARGARVGAAECTSWFLAFSVEYMICTSGYAQIVREKITLPKLLAVHILLLICGNIFIDHP